MFKDLYDSLVRTYSPIIVGAVISWLVSVGVPLDVGVEPAVTALLAAFFAGAYYLVARLLETYVSPKFGWLLGMAKTPEYQDAHAAGVDKSTYRQRYPGATDPTGPLTASDDE